MGFNSVAAPLPISNFTIAAMEDPVNHEMPHFLDACSLCSKPLGFKSDIFMYRGDTPFCSEECRQEQIEVDEAMERRWRKSLARSMRKSESNASTTTKDVRSGTVVVA